MKKIICSLICFCACLPMVAVAFVDGDYDVLFVNNNTEEFTGLLGQIVLRTGLVSFPDAEIPPDPNHPVDRSGNTGWNPGSITPGSYSLEIQNDDGPNFTARILWSSTTSNECTVLVTYCPQSLGTHTATLWAHCSNSGVPTVKIYLRGETTGVLGDLNGDGRLNISDVTGMVNLLLIGDKDSQTVDINGDGMFNIRDVTTLISRLLTDQ